MAALSDHTASSIVKLFYIGNSGSGKTGSLTSLIKAGYKLRIIDLDNGLDALVNHAKHEKLDLSRVEYETVVDTYSIGAGGARCTSKMLSVVKTANLLDKWTDGTNPAEWGPDTILVIDTLTALGKSALEWSKRMNPSFKDPRLWYNPAQNLIEDIIEDIKSPTFHTNVIIMSHIEYREQAGADRAFITAIGKALGPKLPRAFNTMIMAESSGSGKNTKRKIKTYPTGIIDLKNPAPMRMEAEYPLETGLASIFKTLKDAA